MTTSYEAVAKLGFGAMRLPLTDPDDVTAIDIESVKTMVDEFIARGGTYVDTAFVYHNGASETALREALVERYPRAAFTLATKCLAWACASKEEAQACLPTSLERLGVDYIDFYLQDGTVLACVIGDIKSESDANWTRFGHTTPPNGLSVVEFVVDKTSWYGSGHANPGTPSCHPEWKQQIVSASKVGSFDGASTTQVGGLASCSAAIIRATIAR